MSGTQSGEPSRLKLDRTITLSIIMAIVFQTAGALMWAGSAQARLIALEVKAQRALPVNERLARLEEQMDMVRQSQDRIERKLDTHAP